MVKYTKDLFLERVGWFDAMSRSYISFKRLRIQIRLRVRKMMRLRLPLLSVDVQCKIIKSLIRLGSGYTATKMMRLSAA
jgi:hypothetical protein